MKATTKVAIATLSDILLMGSSVNLAAKAQSYEKPQKLLSRKRPKQPSLSLQRKKAYRG